ncbi:hypothetical protein L7F22_048502 [Adiantum nelumboides]|nr:hypothetical protein [Adiantum nelumboides]
MIGPILAKLYGTVMEAALSTLAEGEGLRAAEQAGFRRAFSTTDHIFTLQCLIDQARVKKRRLHCCFVDFRKAFDTVPRERLFKRLAALKVGDEMMWAIFVLYERVTERVRCPGGLSDPLVSTIGVKQGCPLSPTLFGLYIDEIVSFIQSSGGEGVERGGTTVHILIPLPPTMLYYHEHFLSISGQGFIETPEYMQIYMPHRLRVAIGQLRVSSHQLAIKSGTASGIPREERICQLCRAEVESEEHQVIRCPAYSELRAQYPLRPTLRQCMTEMDQRQFGRFLTEALCIREQRLLQSSVERDTSQTTITQFFSVSTTRQTDDPSHTVQ